jgi:hypothetical protein
VEGVLGLVKPPRTPSNLARIRDKHQGREKVREKMYVSCFDDWKLGSSIGCDPLIYIEGVKTSLKHVL